VYLLVFPSSTFKEHWALFVPEFNDRSVKKGKVIHVVVSVRDGFMHEIKRNYDLTKTRNLPHPPVEIGRISTRFVVDTPGNGRYTADAVPQDDFEQYLLSIPAPGKSFNSASQSVSTIPG